MSTLRLKAEFKSALAEAELLKAKDNRTEADLARFKDLADNLLPTLKSQIEAQEAVDSFNLDAYADLTNKTVGTPYSAGRQVGHTSFSATGEAEDVGAGSLTEKQFKAISKPEYKKAFKAFLHYGEEKIRDRYPTTYKALVEGIDEGAGFFVPPDMLSEIIQRKPAPTTMRARVRQLATTSNRVTMLRTKYYDPIRTSPITGQWTGEAGNPSDSPVPTFGEWQIPVYEYMGRLSLSNTMIDDSGFSLESYISQELANWMDLHYEEFLTNGTGVGQPKGVWTTAGQPLSPGNPGAVQSAATGVLDADVVKSMRFNILPQYEQRNFAFIMNQNTAKTISLFKASTGTQNNGMYLFQRGQVYPGIVEPTPDSVDGFPIVYNQFVPDIAAGSYPILFGSLQGYFMPQRMGLTIRVLNEIEALNNRRVFLFRLRWGGDLIQEQYLKFLQIKP